MPTLQSIGKGKKRGSGGAGGTTAVYRFLLLTFLGGSLVIMPQPNASEAREYSLAGWPCADSNFCKDCM